MYVAEFLFHFLRRVELLKCMNLDWSNDLMTEQHAEVDKVWHLVLFICGTEVTL